ncbi:MAG: HAMP domain-containing histidine kinase [Oscillospiraceae bacterium]|nr:HAMP domain-containing histidine kinase [Oscillospiraceae bacterium]
MGAGADGGPHTGQTATNLVKVALIVLPGFLVLVFLGSYWIVKRSFRPLDSISDTASAINEAKDLSRRIGLPPGKDEFSRLADTFDQLFERLERSFETEKQFISDASHELRTPVSVIKGACEYAEQYDETPEERQETISMIHRQAEQMSGLITQLLNLTRLEQGTEQVRLLSLNLGEMVRDWGEEQGDRQGRLILELQEGVTVQGDSGLLLRLLNNLVENGFKYGRPDGHVWVTVSRSGEEALLQVRDDGIGIPTEQQEKVWERFYQVDPARSRGKGSGLGLAMVQQIAALHGGRMTLESVPSLGSAFTLHLFLNQPSEKI